MPTVNMKQLTFIFPVVSFLILPLKKEKEYQNISMHVKLPLR